MCNARIRFVLLGLLAAVLAAPSTARAEGAPTNEELHRMFLEQQKLIEEVRADQQRLKQEAADARADATSARAEAANARVEAKIARQELARAQERITSVETRALPDVAAAEQEPAARQGAFASFDALYWDLDAGKERDYVVVQQGSPSGDVRGDVKSVEWDGSWGFRGEGGWRFGNGIDLLMRGVRMNSDGDDSEVDPNGNMTALSLFHEEDDFSDLDVSLAEIEMDVDFFMIDVESGKWFSIGDGVDLRPFLTLRYADFDYSLDSRFCSVLGCPIGGFGPNPAELVEIHESDVSWWGAGILGGLEGEWRFLNRFKVFGRGAAGVLGGEYTSRGRVFEPHDTDEFHLTDEHGDTFVPVLEGSVGLGVRLLETDAFALNLEAGYEVLSFFDSPQPFQGLPDDEESPADFDEETVTFHGAFLRVGADF